MRNEIVRQFFENYFLIQEQGFNVFTREQSKLFAADLVTVTSDIRGIHAYYGINGFFEGMIAWSRHFFVNGKSRHEYVEETPTHVLVRMHGDLRLLEPINGLNVSVEDDHEWTKEFELTNGLISKIDIKLFFHQHA